jgi:hypothetical protein
VSSVPFPAIWLAVRPAAVGWSAIDVRPSTTAPSSPTLITPLASANEARVASEGCGSVGGRVPSVGEALGESDGDVGGDLVVGDSFMVLSGGWLG